jgi:Xaa-Pro aminopeptidase
MNPRLMAFQKHILNDAAMVEDPTDLLYLTGLSLSKGTLVVTKDDAALFVDGRYFAVAERKAPCAVRLTREASGPSSDPLFEWLQGRSVRTLEFDSFATSYDRFVGLQRSMQGMELLPRKSLLQKPRSVKEPHEIALLKKAQNLTFRGLEHVEGKLKEGISEEELAFEFEVFVRKNGASGLSFGPIVAFGENTAYPHHRAGKTKLTKNQPVLIDVGAIVEEYHGDLTRVVFFGEPHPLLQKWLIWTQLAQRKAMDAVRAGILVKELDLIARAVFAEHGVEEKFSHGLGHGIGLETHEFPSLKAVGVDRDAKVSAGMVITIEPGLYQPGVGGVRWEDMIVVLENGYERLS